MPALAEGQGTRARIARTFELGRVSHAMLIVSDKAIDAAREIAASIVCEKRVFPPCGECAGCRKSGRGIHPDIISVSGKNSIQVDQIRQMRIDAYVSPNDCDRKVYIIERASTMTEQAQNAFLKILEQPPEGVFFLLADVSSRGLIDTVLSRVSKFIFTEEAPGQAQDGAEELYRIAVRRDEAETALAVDRAFGGDREKASAFLEELMRFTAQRAISATDEAEMCARLYEQARLALTMLENAGNVALCAAYFSIKCWEAVV